MTDRSMAQRITTLRSLASGQQQPAASPGCFLSLASWPPRGPAIIQGLIWGVASRSSSAFWRRHAAQQSSAEVDEAEMAS